MLPINNIYPCIQGEGCNTGIPMVMIRLQICGVGCPFCDTKETWEANPNYKMPTIEQALGQNPKWTMQDERDIMLYIQEHYPDFQWILISGGEPAQYELSTLTSLLHDYGHKVAIETSGTEEIRGNFDWVCVSPKIDMPGKKAIKAQPMLKADEIKMVIGKPSDFEKLDTLLREFGTKLDCQICLQPMSQSPKATQLCIEKCQKRGYRLSIQLHKYLGVE